MSTAEVTTFQIGPHSNGTRLTPCEFDEAEFQPGYCYELVNGVLIVGPPPSLNERDPNEELGHWLKTGMRRAHLSRRRSSLCCPFMLLMFPVARKPPLMGRGSKSHVYLGFRKMRFFFAGMPAKNAYFATIPRSGNVRLRDSLCATIA